MQVEQSRLSSPNPGFTEVCCYREPNIEPNGVETETAKYTKSHEIEPIVERVNVEETNDDITQDGRHVIDKIPRIVWVAMLAGAAERFTFYSVTGPWQNYMQYGADNLAVRGELGLGQAVATNIFNAFYFFSYLSPLIFAIVSDTWLGRYKTLCISFGLNLCGCFILLVTSIPHIVGHEGKLGGLISSMVLIGLGTGGVKATISPFIGDQYVSSEPRLLTSKNGERLIGDRTLTLQYIYNAFYWLTNMASLSLIGSTYLEKALGFWASYLLSMCSFWVAVLLLLVWGKDFVKPSPQGNILPRAAKILVIAAREKFQLDAAKPAYQLERYGKSVPWDDHFVAEMKTGLIACKVMACFALFYLCVGQMANNFVSQAGQMQLNGIPNDTIQALNPIACVLLGPLIQSILYPSLRKHGINFGTIARMTTGFVIMAAAMAYAAGLQRLIYRTGPCYKAPLACAEAENGRIPNAISVWVQIPVYFLVALAEIFGFVTLSEYSYSKAPKDMRSLVQAIRQVSAGVGSAFGIALSPLSVDPKILWMYTALALILFISAPVFWIAFSKYDIIDKEVTVSDEKTEK